jgi:hypothetical protein
MVVSSSAQLNSLPVVAGVSISPSSATESTPLSASYTSVSDADAGQTVSVSWQWSLGGTPITGATTASLTGANFDSGDSITVTATPNDTLEDGLAVTSTPVVIDNTPPSMTSVDITPTTAYTDTTLTANPAGWSDPDADTPSYLYEWFAGSSAVGSDSATLAGSEFIKGDLVIVQVTPNDASSSGSPVLSNPGVTILNTLPTAPVVSISPATPDDSQDLVCSVSSPSGDVDPGDNVTYGYSWQESGGGSGTGATLPSSATAAGETWTCEVTPNDGEGDGPPGNASVGPLEDSCFWDNNTESNIPNATSKAWTYSYANPPNFGGDANYDGQNGALNDGVESYYGDSGNVNYDWTPYWAWWQNDSPSIVVELGDIPLHVTSIGAYWSHGVGGGISVPSWMQIFHRPDPSSAWTSLGAPMTVSPAIGWATIPVQLPTPGGELRMDASYASQHTILGELSVQGACVTPVDADGDGYFIHEDCDDNAPLVYPQAGDTYGDGVDSDCDGLDCEAGSDGTTYFAVCGPASSFTEGDTSCQAAGYTYGSIRSAAENAFVRNLVLSASIPTGVPGTVRLGYSDTAVEGNWVWEDGYSSSYANWYPGEPNDGGCCGQDCAYLDANSPRNGRWDDGACGPNTYPFLCTSR